MTTTWLSVAQAARRLNLSTSRVHELIKAGAIPSVKTGTTRTSPRRITAQAVAEYDARRPR